MNLKDLRIYNAAMEIGEEVWILVDGWNYFQKDTIGRQLVKAADSIAANISEGFGRYHFKDSKNFAYYSRGSLYETKTWLTKANTRKLLAENTFAKLMDKIEALSRMLNSFINSIGHVSEPNLDYTNVDRSPSGVGPFALTDDQSTSAFTNDQWLMTNDNHLTEKI